MGIAGVQAPLVPGKSIPPYLVHEGAIEYAGRLAGWGTDQAGGDDEQTVEAIEPGVYALCLVADPAELKKLWAGAAPQEKCGTGSVEPGRTLTLAPK
jgi:hypothetical protein